MMKLKKSAEVDYFLILYGMIYIKDKKGTLINKIQMCINHKIKIYNDR